MNLADFDSLRQNLRKALEGEVKTPTALVGLTQKSALKILNLAIGQAVPFARRNYFTVTACRDGKISAQIRFRGNRNHFGGMYAGAIFTLAEIPGGVLTMLNMDKNYYPILKSLNMDFLRVAKTDVSVTFHLSEDQLQQIQMEAATTGKGEFVLQGSILDHNQQEVARSKAVYQVRLKN